MLVAGVVIGVFTDAARGSDDEEAEKGCEGDKKGEEEEEVEDAMLGAEEDEERREGGSGTPVAGIDPKACWTLSPDENWENWDN